MIFHQGIKLSLCLFKNIEIENEFFFGIGKSVVKLPSIIDIVTAVCSDFLNHINGFNNIDYFFGHNNGADNPVAGFVIRIFKTEYQIKFFVFSFVIIFVAEAVAYARIITEIPVIFVIGRIFNKIVHTVDIPADNVTVNIVVNIYNVIIVFVGSEGIGCCVALCCIVIPIFAFVGKIIIYNTCFKN